MRRVVAEGYGLCLENARRIYETIPGKVLWTWVADVRREVEDNLRILGAGGGHILGPCHNIEPVTPPECIVALYDPAYERGVT